MSSFGQRVVATAGAAALLVAPAAFPRLRSQRLATYFSQGGDSGGSVLNNSTAKGVHSGRVTYSDGTTRAVYSHTYEVLLRTGQTNIVGA